MKNKISRCKDCGLELLNMACENVKEGDSAFNGATRKHAGICCGCFDELMGMPARLRKRPRPESKI